VVSPYFVNLQIMSESLQSAPHEHNLGKAFSDVKSIFDGLNVKERLQLLKAVGGLYGHRVLPGAGNSPPPTRGSVSVGAVPKGPAQPKSSKSRESREIQKKISELNSEIKRKAASTGGILPAGDSLFELRNQLFRDYKSSHEQIHSEETSEGIKDRASAKQSKVSSSSSGGA